MPKPLDESVVVITGASSGIGRATALACARRGATVVLAARRADALQEAAAECEALGGTALAVPTDVTDEEAVRGLARRAVERFGRIDAWVNNAGAYVLGTFESIPPDVFRRVIETNLLGVVHGTRAVLPIFRGQGGGVLVNVASVNGKVGSAYASAYCASKFGVLGFTECVRQEQEVLGEGDIRVCAVLPAAMNTPLFAQAANYTGRAIRPIEPVYDPEAVAGAIVGLIEHPEREVVVGGAGKQMILMRRLAPGLFDRMTARHVEATQLTDRPAPNSPGNLFTPATAPAAVHGGWTQTGSTLNIVGAVALGAAALAGLGLGAWMLGRTERGRDMADRIARRLPSRSELAGMRPEV
jgi:NAD(P)-dependent dehydrogenase (short-subunit alcohol dehydrogenase family)